MVNLPPLSATYKNTLSFWGAGKAHRPDTLPMQPQLFCCVFVVSSFPERSTPKCLDVKRAREVYTRTRPAQ
ncbi:hypothetical protein LEMLEM_LOCUS6481 [Lemmus lemmus]